MLLWKGIKESIYFLEFIGFRFRYVIFLLGIFDIYLLNEYLRFFVRYYR